MGAVFGATTTPEARLRSGPEGSTDGGPRDVAVLGGSPAREPCDARAAHGRIIGFSERLQLAGCERHGFSYEEYTLRRSPVSKRIALRRDAEHRGGF